MRKVSVLLMMIIILATSCNIWEGIGTIDDKLGEISSKIIWKDDKIYFIRAYEEYDEMDRMYHTTRYVVNELDPYAGQLYSDSTDKLTWGKVSYRGFLSESEDYLLFNYN